MKGLLCPVCDKRHGQSVVALVGSSKYSPIKCGHCGNCFHFAGWLWALLLPIMLPVGLIEGSSWAFHAAFRPRPRKWCKSSAGRTGA